MIFDFLDRDPYMTYRRHIQVEAEEDAARRSRITVLNLVQPQDVVSESQAHLFLI